MQKKVVVMAAALMAWGTVALAAPSQPVYKISAPYVKITEGENNVPGGKSLVVDGKTIYSINQTQGNSLPDAPQTPELRITRSFDGGITWNASETINKFVGSDNDGYGLKVTNDPVFPGQKQIHTIWSQNDSTENGVFYKYFSTQTGTWSDKVSLNNAVSPAAGYGNTFAIDGNGSVHALFGGADENWNWSLYYTTASAAGAPFTYPTAILSNVYTADSTIDKLNNLLVTYTAGDGHAYFMKKTAGTSDWSTPVRVSTGDDLGNWYNSSITSFDANNIYILHQMWSKLVLAKSSDGGVTWSTATIVTAPANMAFGGNYSSIVVNPTNKTLTVATELDNWSESSFQSSNVYVYKSFDGISWSAPKIYSGLEHPSLSIDASGKTYLTMGNSKRDMSPSLASPYYTPRSVYFTKE